MSHGRSIRGRLRVPAFRTLSNRLIYKELKILVLQKYIKFHILFRVESKFRNMYYR